MSKVIGILGGMGSYATVEIFRRVIDAFPAEKEWDRPRILIDNNCIMPSRVRAILYEEKREELIEAMTESINQLVRCGAEQIILGCVTAHCFFDRLPHQDIIVSMITETAKAVGEEVFGDKFVLEGEDELFLSGDNAYRYFRETRGLFTVFLAGIPGENHPLHHPKFQLDERILPYSVEALYKIITTL